MTAAVKTLTVTARTQLGKYELVCGTVTIANTLDWVLTSALGLGAPLAAWAHTAADGVDGEAFIAVATKVQFTQTGAMQVSIIAPSIESTGGD